MPPLTENLFREESQPSVFKRLLQPAFTFVLKQEQQLFRHHNQTFSYSEFFRFLIFFFTTDISSLHLFINTYLKHGLLPPGLGLRPVAYSTFFEHLNVFLRTCLEACLNICCQRRNGNVSPNLKR